ncbi:MAG: glutaredoxin family protein [Bacillota bacterium]|nr:glutaredoxin family protein [Bacillota bacterium]
MATVKVYSTLTCPWCKVTKDYLRSRNIPFEDIDVGLNRAAAQEMIEISGQYGVPVITIDGEVVVGFDRAKIDRLLAHSA